MDRDRAIAEAVREAVARKCEELRHESCETCDGEGTGATEGESCDECGGDGTMHAIDAAAKVDLSPILARFREQPGGEKVREAYRRLWKFLDEAAAAGRFELTSGEAEWFYCGQEPAAWEGTSIEERRTAFTSAHPSPRPEGDVTEAAEEMLQAAALMVHANDGDPRCMAERTRLDAAAEALAAALSAHKEKP